jgi:hypothetical protein
MIVKPAPVSGPAAAGRQLDPVPARDHQGAFAAARGCAEPAGSGEKAATFGAWDFHLLQRDLCSCRRRRKGQGSNQPEDIRQPASGRATGVRSADRSLVRTNRRAGGFRQQPWEAVMTITEQRSGRAVENSIGIAAPAETVFDYVTDVRREREWNPQLREAEKLTPGPIGAGTRYRVRFGRGAGTAVIENTAFNRPRGWSAISTSRRLEVHFRGQVTEFPGGCQLAVQTELCPRRALRVLSPFLRRLMRRSWEKDLAVIKAIVEH